MSLKKIARTVRKIVEEDIVEQGDKITDDLGSLCGACGYASYGLHKAIPGSKLVIGRFEGDGHAWVEYKDKIVDITATQFGGYPEVYVVKKGGKRAQSYKPNLIGRAAVRNLDKWDYPKNFKVRLTHRVREATKRLSV